MKKIWNGKNIEKIYEEILPINNKVYFITTFQHVDNSITEKIMYFQQITNGDIQVVNQIKNYENFNEYKKDTTLIGNISINNNINFQFVPLKDFIQQQTKLKLKPSKTEFAIWGVISIFSFGIPTLISCLPLIKKEYAEEIKNKIIIGLISVTVGWFIKSAASTVLNATKKVDSWFYNKWFKSHEKKEKEKEELKNKIKDLTSDKIETKLETQFNILKQELDNKKNTNIKKLKANIFLENSNIEQVNINNFDSSVKISANDQNQASTSNRTHYLYLIS